MNRQKVFANIIYIRWPIAYYGKLQLTMHVSGSTEMCYWLRDFKRIDWVGRKVEQDGGMGKDEGEDRDRE